jgi:hypothetical protein
LKGPTRKKIGDPRGGGWVGQRPKKDWGQIFSDVFFVVFLNSPHRETPKKRDKKFRHNFFSKRFFCSVFELPSLKHPKTQKKIRGKPDIGAFVDFFGKRFLYGLFAKCFVWCF